MEGCQCYANNKKEDKKDPKKIQIDKLIKFVLQNIHKNKNTKLKRYSATFLDQTQSGFIKGRSCIDSAFTLKVLLYVEKKRI